MLLDDDKIKNVTVLYCGFTGSVTGAENGMVGGVLIAASYSGEKLIDVQTKDISENTMITLDEMNLNRQNAYRITAMLWTNHETPIPLCEAAKRISE